eukprot:GSChrysophyteH1.ASY1.ANO1.1975.1 assembled CDS
MHAVQSFLEWTLCVFLLSGLFMCKHVALGLDTGFWYDSSRPPESQYSTLPYANLKVKIQKPYQEGPGKDLIIDPFDFSSELFTGNTIARQSFDTQFILDMHYALGIDPDRLLVINVQKGLVHFSWESTSVIVNFALIERNQTGLNTLSGQSMLETIATLTNLVQLPDSKIYWGTNVTRYIDPNYGVEVDGWDISLELTYSIEIVGRDAVVDGYFLNMGAKGVCESPEMANFSTYCEFERFFEDDVSRSLGISYYRIQIMFIKKASFDSVYVYFRVSPPNNAEAELQGLPLERNISSAIGLLHEKVADFQSDLYDGNVTIRVNPLWGVSGMNPQKRKSEARFTKKYYEYEPGRLADPIRYSLLTPYDRCKQNHRCNWGQYQLDQSTNDVKYFQRLFDRGNMYGVNLFLDFEDWRLGSRGFSWKGYIPPTQAGKTSIPMARALDGVIRGAHFWPFDQASLGPDIPCYLDERNQGLVLDRTLQQAQIRKQEALVTDLDARIAWMWDNVEWSDMGPELRSRKDVRTSQEWKRADFRNWWLNEVYELKLLNSSMCSELDCWLRFDTSTLQLTGAIEGTGVIRKTDLGTEVAVFSFNSITLGPEVKVTIVGQRAISLVSKTTFILNTTIFAEPGTIGGMQGGGSVGRFDSDRLSDNPSDPKLGEIDTSSMLRNITYNPTNLPDGQYPLMRMYGGSGSEAVVDITVEGGTVTGTHVIQGGTNSDFAGTGYSEGDKLTVPLRPTLVIKASQKMTSQAGALDENDIFSSTTKVLHKNLPDGFYPSMNFIGGTGSGAKVDVTVTDSAISAATVVAGGGGYSDSNELALLFDTSFVVRDAQELVGTAHVTITNALMDTPGVINVVDLVGSGSLTTNPTNLVDGSYVDMPLVGGTGTGATVSVTVASNTVTSAVVSAGGSGYSDNDVLSIKFGVLDSADIIDVVVSNNANLVDGTYNGMKLYGGTGSGAVADVTVAGSVVTSCLVTSGGSGYTDGDTLFLNFDVSFTITTANELSPVATFTVRDTSDYAAFSITDAGEMTTSAGELDLGIDIIGVMSVAPTDNLVDGTYTGMSLVGGTGAGAQADVIVVGNTITAVKITASGSGYTDNDALTLHFDSDAVIDQMTDDELVVSITNALMDTPGVINVVELVGSGSLTTNPTNLVDGSYVDMPLVGGTGTGATVSVTVASNTVTSAVVSAGGSGYSDNDVLSIKFGVLDALDLVEAAETWDSPQNLLSNGTFAGMKLFGGSGSGALAKVIIKDGAVISATVTAGGQGYADGDVLELRFDTSFTVTNANMIGAPGVLDIFDLMTVVDFAPPLNVADGTYSSQSLSGGSGSGATVTVVVTDGVVTQAIVDTGGSNYADGDVLFLQFGALVIADMLDTVSKSVPANMVDGEYVMMPLHGGTGSGATANVTVSGGSITAAPIHTAGVGYSGGDVLTLIFDPTFVISNDEMVFLPGTLDAGDLMAAMSQNAVNLLDGIYTGMQLYGGTGVGATVDVTVTDGTVTVANVNDRGAKYVSGDALFIKWHSTITISATTEITVGASSGAIDTGDYLAVLNEGTSPRNLAGGTFTNWPLLGGAGAGAKATVTIETNPVVYEAKYWGTITALEVTDGGSGYADGDLLFLKWDTVFTITADFMTSIPGKIDMNVNLVDAVDKHLTPNLADGVFDNMMLFGGTGSGASVDVVVAEGVVLSAKVTSGGDGYSVGDELSLKFEPTFLLTDSDAIFSNVPLYGGTSVVGTGAEASVTVQAGAVTLVTVTSIGNGAYAAGNKLVIEHQDIGISAAGVDLEIELVGVWYPGSEIIAQVDTNPIDLTDGTYENVNVAGGSGTSGKVRVIVSGETVSSIVVTDAGFGYSEGDSINIEHGRIGTSASSTDVTLTLRALALNDELIVRNIAENVEFSPPTDIGDRTYVNVDIQGGSGERATANVRVAAGTVTHVIITDGGNNAYISGDEITFPHTAIGTSASAQDLTIILNGVLVVDGDLFNDITINPTDLGDMVHTDVAFIGGTDVTGANGRVDVEVVDGTVTSVTVTDVGNNGYVSDDLIVIKHTDIGVSDSGSDLSLTLSGALTLDGDLTPDITFNPTDLDAGEMTGSTGIIDTIEIVSAIRSNNANLVDGTYNGMKLYGGTGSGAVADVTVAGSVVTSCLVTSGGSVVLAEPFISNSVNGPGSGNLRVHPFVITTSATDYREVQVIRTQAQDGQTLAGGFKLHFKGYETPIIAHDATASDLKSVIEQNLNLIPPSNAPVNTDRVHGTVSGVGNVEVSRSPQDNQEGYTWSLTFTSYIGNMEEITFTNYLQGLGASMTIHTDTDGNELGGSFELAFQDDLTGPIDINISAADLKEILLSLPKVSTAFVTRIDPTENCDDGLCNNGPNAARGLIWSCVITTDLNYDNITPTSPTSQDTYEQAEFFRVTADGSHMTGDGASIVVDYGLSKSPNQLMSELTITSPFSLAFGGGGGSYGNFGGKGYADNPVGPIYNDDKLTDLIGGSGGSMRGINTFGINALKEGTTGLGGHGGGAIEIIAANDIVVGLYGQLRVDGQDGEQSAEGGGGGGSGGAVLLAAGGTIVNYGTISASGGKGGFGGTNFPHMSGGGGSGGRVSMYAESVTIYGNAIVEVNGGKCGAYKKLGITNTLRANISMHVEMHGGEGTRRALHFSNDENTNTTSGSFREAPFPWNGPIVAFEASRPTRVTYYTRMSAVPGQTTKKNFGALFSLLSRGEAGLETANVIGIFLGNTIMHGANFGTAVDEKVFLKRFVTIGDYPAIDKWFKISIFIQWEAQTYYVTVDDTVLAKDQPFKADDIDGIRLSTMRSCKVWYDEIYVGFDNTMNFMCPTTSRDKGTQTMSPEQKHWSLEELVGEGSTGYTEYKRMSRHYSHLDDTDSVQFDGKGLVTKSQDIKYKYESGDYPILQGQLKAGAMNYLTNSPRSTKSSSGRSSTTYNYQDLFTNAMNGGIMACSSQDLLTWRFEGIIFHYTNVSDMVYGSAGPFAVERPKVRWNPSTSEYVMWGVMDNLNRSLAMAFVATSPFEDGPFLFKRSFYPDGNKTRDQVVFINEENKPVLARTYYQTVEFLQPEAIMQPIWESVKDKDGLTDFRANYLRGNYDEGYDNFHDIFYQRWRKETEAYKILCINRLNADLYHEVYAGQFLSIKENLCYDPEEYKVNMGQGETVVNTNFFTPNSSENSWWIQTSVPGVKAQPWASSYRDGYCGIRVLDDNLDIEDSNLVDFQPEDRSTCSNIADNPPHPAMEDKLIGRQRVVASRRAKFMAISELTDDLMDTTGALNSFEGELDSGDLISMIIEMGQFGFGAGEDVRSTFRPPVRSEYDTALDYKTRFYQYINNYNDRAIYSLGCILDGTCPVNFKDQMTDGNV